MRTLFIDTSSSDVSIAVINDGKILSSINKTIPNAHSIYTVSFLDKVIRDANLTPNDIDKILVVTGPGSFTGVRIGVTIAKTYAYLRNISIVSVSSLKMLALSTSHNYSLSLIDAKHNNYYIGLYDKDNNEVIEEQFNNKDNNEVIEEQFNNKDKVLELINKYNPTIVSNEDIKIDDIEVKKQILDLKNIVSYYQDKEPINPHLVVPNYLKLPQALEEQR